MIEITGLVLFGIVIMVNIAIYVGIVLAFEKNFWRE